MRFNTVKKVSSWRLCVGCGACAYICPEKKIRLIDVINEGIRPALELDSCKGCSECIKVCPGIESTHSSLNGTNGLLSQLRSGWGPVLEVWEGYATDPEIRFKGSSGGLASAIALYCLEKGDMYGVLHIGADSELPWKNISVLSHNREDLLIRTGSRYSPASPCDRLEIMESAQGRCVFIGKPCDITGLRKAQQLRPALDTNVGLAIGIFCAGTPSTAGTLELFKKLKVEPNDVAEIRYRGNGWPGMATVRANGKESPCCSLSYMEAWGLLQKYRPYRCYLCPDGTSEFADISCGDPWYRTIQGNEQGYSLLLVRTENGQKIVRKAIEAGYISLERVDPNILVNSQKNLLLKRKAIWGRLITMKAFIIPVPRLNGFSLFNNWVGLPLIEKIRSILGTARRILQRRYFRPL